MKIKWAIIILNFFALSSNAQNNIDILKYVNPFIGTGGDGHTFPNACMPHGNVQIGPQTEINGWDYTAGYRWEDTTLMGFSHTRLSGTGCGSLGDILFMPRIGDFTVFYGSVKKPFPGWRSRFSHNDEVATPGYYSVVLSDYNVKAEFTASQRCAVHRYTFPSNDSAHIIIAPSVGIEDFGGITALSQLSWINDSTIAGYRLSFGWVPFRKVHFVARFSKPFYTFQITTSRKPNWRNRSAEGRFIVGSVYFRTRENESVEVKVGISAVSIENAEENLEKEIGARSFEQVKSDAEQAWLKKLSTIRIQADQKTKEIFYSAMYHAFIHPNDITDINGEYQNVKYEKAKSPSGKYFSTLSLWDTFRALHPLYTIIQPKLDGEIVRSMVEHADVQGFLPVWTLWGAENYCMIANNAIPVVADAILKDLSGFDYEKAYQAMKISSTHNHRGSDWDIYDKYGYYPMDFVTKESVSKTLEVSFNDWCVAQVARRLGHFEDEQFFSKRALAYRNLYDKQTNFFRAKDSNGNWLKPFNPLNITHAHGYTEGNAWQYYWSVLHDIPALVELSGGQRSFELKLDSLFTMHSNVEGYLHDVSGLIGQYAHGNEPSHHVAYLYNYVGKPLKTQRLLTKIMNSMYNNTPEGITGNEDCGQMSAWYIFTALGFYPVNPASGEFQIGRPFVEKAEFMLVNGRVFRIETKNLGPTSSTVKRIYINGKELQNYTLKYSDIMNGGKLVFIMN